MSNVDLTRRQYERILIAVQAPGSTLDSVTAAVRGLNIPEPRKVAEAAMTGRVRILP